MFPARLPILLLAPAIALFLLAAAPPARAECLGENLIDAMPESDRRALFDAADKVPYPRGNLWRATRGDQTIHLVGTYHLDDPRHAATMDRIAPLIDAAATVLVEAGPEEEAALMADLARDPSLMVQTDGPTLREALTDPEWALLADAMRERGMPPFMVSKFRPWYVSMLLALPACGIEGMEAGKGGLDGLVIARTQEQGIPLRALEGHDTVFRLFEAMSMEDQLAMIRSSLALEPISDDYSVTLADAYFQGESRVIWELTRLLSQRIPGQDPTRIEADFARMEQVLMTDRNRAWIPVIEAAAAEGPVFAAFGALHLPGETGILRLLEEAGFTLEPLPL
ncbi:TraB/GumN family protein [Tabrizicola sp. TH137]|uniref:TraB/GumN family protein n=1 Tax=Tabrizicola sp. TH137 TaxID=2067452 RepID=UPI000C7C8F22|nr:TraB/GumN family protein [Tabrizicola sp. TH137]PLL14089.1 TraB/GumN family protein [Tabrizicola sp. TH137]